MLTFRNELPSAVRVDEIRSKWPAEGLLFAENIDGPEVLYSARLSPGWRIDAATDRWAQLERRIFVWRPQSLRLGERPRKVALEFKLTPQDARWRQMRMTNRTAAIMVIVDARIESIPSALAQTRYMFLQTTANSGARALERRAISPARALP
jgi:hypothetical protein